MFMSLYLKGHHESSKANDKLKVLWVNGARKDNGLDPGVLYHIAQGYTGWFAFRQKLS